MNDGDSDKPIWEQLEGESDAAYARFLAYRNLGAVRSIDAAFRATATKRNKTQRANGQWTNDSTKFQWVERATAWDIEMMSTVGVSTVIRFINALDTIALKSLSKLLDAKTQPEDWKTAIDAINILGNFIPAETVGAIQDNAKAGTIANIGTSGKPD